MISCQIGNIILRPKQNCKLHPKWRQPCNNPDCNCLLDGYVTQELQCQIQGLILVVLCVPYCYDTEIGIKDRKIQMRSKTSVGSHGTPTYCNKCLIWQLNHCRVQRNIASLAEAQASILVVPVLYFSRIRGVVVLILE